MPAPESVLSDLDAEMIRLLRHCNRNISTAYPTCVSIENAGSNAHVVYWSARGFREVDEHELSRAFLHVEKRKFFHATSLESAQGIFADGFLKRGGGHKLGFKEAVMARPTLEEAWFSYKNYGIVFVGTVYGRVSKYQTAMASATQDDRGWEGWRKRFCEEPGQHMHRRVKGFSQFYMNERTIELTGFYVEKNAEMVETLRSVNRRNRTWHRR